MGDGLFGLLPDSILEGVGDSLHSATDRYTYIVSVPKMYHIVGKEQVDALLAKSYQEAWKARRQEEVARATPKKRNKQKNGRKRSGNLILLWGPHLTGLGL